MSTHETIKVRVDSWRPESQQEVNKLLADGWEVVDVEREKHESCHESTISSNETVFYILKKC